MLLLIIAIVSILTAAFVLLSGRFNFLASVGILMTLWVNLVIATAVLPWP